MAAAEAVAVGEAGVAATALAAVALAGAGKAAAATRTTSGASAGQAMKEDGGLRPTTTEVAATAACPKVSVVAEVTTGARTMEAGDTGEEPGGAAGSRSCHVQECHRQSC